MCVVASAPGKSLNKRSPVKTFTWRNGYGLAIADNRSYILSRAPPNCNCRREPPPAGEVAVARLAYLASTAMPILMQGNRHSRESGFIEWSTGTWELSH